MYADQETGLYYNGARYYDPRIGRYISSDPIGLAGGLNTYSYTYNNPLRYIDPSGLSGIDTLYMNDKAPLVVLGRDIGGLAAYAQGLLTGDQALANTAAEGLAESRQTNLDTLAVLATAGRARANGEMCRVNNTETQNTGFLGGKNFELTNAPYQSVRNSPGEVAGREYSGHAFDQMQNRGLVPSVVENTIQTGTVFPTKPGTTGYYDPVNNVRVIVNSQNGRVITTIRGAP